jgi:hypothetical protein
MLLYKYQGSMKPNNLIFKMPLLVVATIGRRQKAKPTLQRKHFIYMINMSHAIILYFSILLH